MKKTSVILIFIIGLCFNQSIFSQEKEEESNEETHESHEESHEEFHRHSIAMFISHTFISQGIQDNDRDWLVAPSWDLAYHYRFSERWAIGVHFDLILEDFVVRDRRTGREELQRSFPFSTAIMGSYKPSEHWAFSLGGGAEWEESENFGMVRLGVEYAIPIPVINMEVLFGLDYDILFDAYDSFNIGIGIAKLF